MGNDPSQFSDLPKETREFLAKLRPEELALLMDGIQLVSSSRVLGRFLKWLLLSIIGAFLAAASLGDAVIKLLSWSRPS